MKQKIKLRSAKELPCFKKEREYEVYTLNDEDEFQLDYVDNYNGKISFRSMLGLGSKYNSIKGWCYLSELEFEVKNE